MRPETSDAAHLIVGAVCKGRQGLGEGACTGSVPADGSVEVQGMMRAFQVVEFTPSVEGALAVLQVGEGTALQQFALQRAVEAFELAEGLGMVGAAVAYVDAQVHEPDGEGRVGLSGVVAPGGAVIHEHGLGQAVAAKDCGEAVLHRCSLLVGTGLESEVEARMIVQESERMAAVVLHGEMPFEVQLPQRVGIGIFKAHLGRVLGAFPFHQ